MSKQNLRIKYSGKSVDNGTIQASEIGKSLIAIEQAILASQTALGLDSIPLIVELNAPQQGSFIVDLTIANGPDFIGHAIDLLSGNEATAIANLMQIIGGTLGAVSFVKQIGKKSYRKIRKIPDTELEEISFDDGSTMKIESKQLKVFESFEFRKSIREAISPIEADGIDKIEISDNMHMIPVEKRDIKNFEPPENTDEIEELINSTYEVILRIISPNFAGGEWKVSENNSSPYFASIEDEEFLERLDRNQEEFASHDSLKVRLRIVQRQINGSVSTERTIEKILQHIKVSDNAIQCVLINEDGSLFAPFGMKEVSNE
jgi:hypothetical protein